MPSDTPIYRDDRRLRTSRRAYDHIYKARGWRLRPPKDTQTSSPDGGDQTGDTPDDQKE